MPAHVATPGHPSDIAVSLRVVVIPITRPKLITFNEFEEAALLTVSSLILI